MRWISMLTAFLVTVSLYLLLMERDRVMAFAGAQPTAAEVAAPKDEPLRRVSVVAQKSRAQTVQGVVRVRGETEAARQIDMLAETSGRVISEPQRKGARVQAGDILCRLDPGTRPLALAQAQAALDEARINDNASRQLSTEGFASETRVAGSATAIATAEAAVAAARTEIERLTIAAPFAGVLETDAAELGALLQPGALCATVIQLDPVRLVGYVPETELDRIAPGAPAGGRLASGREVLGRVSHVARTADPATRTFRVEVEVANGDGAIRAGQTVEIGIAAPAETAHLLPRSALTLDDTGRIGVRLAAADGTARFVPVTILRDASDGFWATGLPDEADVIVVGQEFVTDGVPVDVTYREAAR